MCAFMSVSRAEVASWAGFRLSSSKAIYLQYFVCFLSGGPGWHGHSGRLSTTTKERKKYVGFEGFIFSWLLNNLDHLNLVQEKPAKQSNCQQWTFFKKSLSVRSTIKGTGTWFKADGIRATVSQVGSGGSGTKAGARRKEKRLNIPVLQIQTGNNLQSQTCYNLQSDVFMYMFHAICKFT